MKNKSLDNLVAAGTIKSYQYDPVNEEGQVGFVGRSSNTERLHIEFPDGNTLTIDSWCSGCLKNTGFSLESNRDY